jgi:small conductance mechanosensitive channel
MLLRPLVLVACLLGIAAAGPAAAQSPLAPPAAPAEAAPAAEPAPEAPSISEALRLLAIVLESPEARAALVEQLREAERAVPAAEPGPDEGLPGEPPEPEAPKTLPQLIVEEVIDSANALSDGVLGVLGGLVDIRDLLLDFRTLRWSDIDGTVTSVALSVAVVVATLLGLRLATRPLWRRLDAGAAAANVLGRTTRRGVGGVLGLVEVGLAWIVGLAVSVSTLESGAVTVAQARFFYAFLWTEAVRLGLRLVFQPRYPALRMVTMEDALARHLNFWLARITGLLGYGLIFLVPQLAIGPADNLTEWLSLIIVVVAFVMAAALILRNRRRVRHALLEKVDALPDDAIKASLRALARVWHLLALGYITALFVVWRTTPGNAERAMLEATGWSALAILVGSITIAILSRWISGGVRVSAKLQRKLPLLESRLNSVVPVALMVLRFLVAGLILAAILTVWGLVDFPGWAASDVGQSILTSLAWIAAILLVAGIAWILVFSWVEYRLNPDLGHAPTARERTLLALFSNAFIIMLVIITAMAVLRELGINVAPLIAGAGVAGLAIGFGAQKLVQDIINGAFIQFENTMNEGDVVTAGPITGVVEKLTIRSVSLRDVNGCYHMIPFSSVDTVTNFTKTFSFYVADVTVAYSSRVEDVRLAMVEAFDRLMQTESRANILPPFEWFGVERFADSAVVVRGRIKTLPGQQWGVGRAYNGLIKEVFDERGIEIPFPHRTIYFGHEPDGSAAPAGLLSGRGKGEPGAGTPRTPHPVSTLPLEAPEAGDGQDDGR